MKKYDLPVHDRTIAYTGAKYQAVAAESIQVVWTKADEILNRATEMYYGRPEKK